MKEHEPIARERAAELQRRYEEQRRAHRERMGLPHSVGNRNG
jgi:hypothetical protein